MKIVATIDRLRRSIRIRVAFARTKEDSGLRVEREVGNCRLYIPPGNDGPHPADQDPECRRPVRTR